MKSRKIVAVSAIDDSERHSWNAFKCIYGELCIDNEAYCINGGKWYRINNEFVDHVKFCGVGM
ncbi:MAG: TIGR04141 family sporadically distributed protein [Vulcanibacillus sp.]